MKKRRFPKLLFLLFLLLIVAGLIFGISQKERSVGDQKEKTGLEQMADAARAVFDQEPEQVKKLREQETAQTEEGHQEYYFQLLKDQEKVIYRQMLQGIRERKEEFYLTSSEDEVIDRAYHAVLKDHPELFWIHNREAVYRTTYPGEDYSLFSPGYTYTNQEVQEIQAAMEQGYQEMTAMIPENADDYEKVKTVYTYLIDTTEYVSSDHDQNLAGVFWKDWGSPVFMWRGVRRAARRDTHGILCCLTDSIIMWMLQMEISRNFWKGMRFSLWSTKQLCMIISVRFLMSTGRFIRHQKNFPYRNVQQWTKIFMC